MKKEICIATVVTSVLLGSVFCCGCGAGAADGEAKGFADDCGMSRNVESDRQVCTVFRFEKDEFDINDAYGELCCGATGLRYADDAKDGVEDILFSSYDDYRYWDMTDVTVMRTVERSEFEKSAEDMDGIKVWSGDYLMLLQKDGMFFNYREVIKIPEELFAYDHGFVCVGICERARSEIPYAMTYDRFEYEKNGNMIRVVRRR